MILKVSEEVKAYLKARLAEEARAKAARKESEKWLDENCSNILAEKPPPTTAGKNVDLAAEYEYARKEEIRQKCEEWRRAKGEAKAPVATPLPRP